MTSNLMNMTQGFMAPDFVQKFSGILGQPAEKIQTGLKSIIPTFLMGLVSKGESPEGAERLVHMVREQDYDLTPATFSQMNDERYLKTGNAALNGIFGGSLSSIVNKLGTVTGMNASNIVKMMGMLAPMIMGVLGSKVKSENLDANELKSFLTEEKGELAEYVPNEVENLFHHESEQSGRRRNWLMIGVVSIAILFFFLWWKEDRKEEEAITESPHPSVSAVQNVLPAIDQLGSFFNSGAVGELPKRFRFQHLIFETGTAALAGGSDTELNQIAKVMKEHPSSRVRLESFTDNVGSNANMRLAERRAQAVKEELISRGVKADQIEAVGMGSVQSTSNRIEFVVTATQ